MLVLTRRQDESLKIGKDIKVTVLDIEKKHVQLCINGSESITIDKWKSKVIADGIKISVEKINRNQVKLGIKAPEDVTINREEVYMKDQVGNVLSSDSGIIEHTIKECKPPEK